MDYYAYCEIDKCCNKVAHAIMENGNRTDSIKTYVKKSGYLLWR